MKVKKTKLPKPKKNKNVKVKKSKSKISNGNHKETKSLHTLSVDEFLENELEKSDSELSNNDKALDNINESNNEESDVENNENFDDSMEENYETEDVDEDPIEKHKQSLAKLKDTDPEFYKFLEENDKKLLSFQLSDEESENEADEADEDEKLHKPDTELEVASDESDFEDPDTEKDENSITLKLLKTWQKDIQTDKSKNIIQKLGEAFHAALLTISSDDQAEPSMYKVEGSAIFNGVIQLCVLEFGPAVRRYLGISSGSKQPPHKTKKFNKIKTILKSYFIDLHKLLSAVTSANIQTVLLKHLHYMSSLLTSFSNTAKSMLKRLIIMWSTAEESVRVISFFCILRLTNNNLKGLLDTVLKSMYLTYTKNSKFVSPSSLASINFMRRSLIEMFTLDSNVTYQHAFLYIRQLAIHLRNAIVVNKKENIQTVYNWQYINSLKLWGGLLEVSCNKPLLQQLIYPFIQVAVGVIKLVPTAQYYPLRFHLTETLISLSRSANVFIPILPFILDVLNNYDFNKKNLKVSMKPLYFTFILRASKSQMQENGFKDRLIELAYEQLLEYLSDQSHNIAFPDLVVMCIFQIKSFLKKCRNVNYNKKIKQLLEKIQQNAEFMETERLKHTFELRDLKKIQGIESQIRVKGTPLSTYFESWNKVRNIRSRKAISDNDKLGDYKLPTIKKIQKSNNAARNKDEPVELFPSDSEEEEEEKPKQKKPKAPKIKKKKKDYSGPVEDTGEKGL